MNKPIVSQIVAIGEDREMGKNNDLPWGRALPTDMKRFREKTRGHVVIMGRRTFESMQSNPLPYRINIVITREKDYKPEGIVIKHSIEDAIEEAKKTEQTEIFVIGGAQIFEVAMPYTDKIYLTKIAAKFPDADTFFPDYSAFKKEVYREKVSENGYDYEFIDLLK